MKTFAKIFWFLVAIVAMIIAQFGFIAPYLISANSDELVLLGTILTVVIIFLLILLIYKFIKSFIKDEKIS